MTQLLHRRADGILSGGGRAARIGIVCAVKGKVGLIQLAYQVAVLHKQDAALLHIGFGFLNLALRQKLVHALARLAHLGAKVKLVIGVGRRA
ncbi:MAG: hypothetical protein ACK4JD_08010, partial [Thermoflexales bacterium]